MVERRHPGRRPHTSDERLDLGGQVLGAAELGGSIRIDSMLLSTRRRPSVTGRAVSPPASAPPSSSQISARPDPLCSPKVSSAPIRLDHREARVGRRVAVVVDDRVGRDRTPLL
jgi:hypothetical protein